LLGNITPAIAEDEVELDDEFVLLHGPLALGNMRVQMIVPSFTTLLSDTSWKIFSHISPVFGALGLNDSGQDLIFLLGPCAFGKVTTVVQLEPARVALNF
jgi:hypothetical protein